MIDATDTLLSHREFQVYAHQQQGRTIEQIARRIDLSPSTVGEYSRRINQKYDRAKRTIELLETDKPLYNDIMADYDGQWYACLRCQKRVCIEGDSDEWHHLSPSMVDGMDGDGWCDDCVVAYEDEARDLAIEKGRIPCYHPDHSTHMVNRDVLEDCRPLFIPLPDDTLEAIREAYRD